MSYQLITKYQSANAGYDPYYHHGGNVPKLIVIHHWGQDGQSFDGVCSWLCRHNGDSSAHFVVEAGKVAQLMPVTDAAWHVGIKSINMQSIGIECRPEMSDGDLQTVVELVTDLFNKYGEMPVRGHKDFVPTQCPGRYYKKLSYIHDMAKSRCATANRDRHDVSTSSKKQDRVRAFQAWLNRRGGWNLMEDGIWGADTNDAAIKHAQKMGGVDQDGIIGPMTRSILPDTLAQENNSEGQWVEWWQGVLSKFGYWDVAMDGVFGPKTDKATRSCQKKLKLTADGIAGRHTIEAALKAKW